MADPTPTPAPSKATVFLRRSFSTLALWALVTTIFVSRSSWAYLGLIAVLTVIATLEFFRMLKAAKVPSYPCLGLGLAIGYCAALQIPLARGYAPHPALDGLFLFAALAGAFTLQLRHPVKGLESLLSVAANVLGFVYIAFLFNFLSRIIFLTDGAVAGKVADQGAYLMLWVLAVTKFTDMGAYITGSMIGRHKMIPHISPGKTWEGFGGALIFSQIAGCGMFVLFPKELAVFGNPGNYGHVVILGFLLAILAVIGDLAESVVKRALEAKDSGRMLPGIGGALDLIDSVCFTAPATYFYLKWFLHPGA